MSPSVPGFPFRRALRAVLFAATLLTTNLLCAQTAAEYGENQSPINIRSSAYKADLPRFSNIDGLRAPLTFTLKNTTGSAWCEGCLGKVDQRWGSLKAYPVEKTAGHIVFGGSSYTLVEFHFHTPAEHLINGQLAEMEVHFVFKKDTGESCATDELLVIGQRIVHGAINRELDRIFNKDLVLPASYQNPPVTVPNFVIANVLYGLSFSYRYEGSLTAPADLGCKNPPGNPNDQLASGNLPQVVSWVLLRDPISMSPNQIAKFQKLFPNGDARGPQAIQKQVVLRTWE